MSTRSINRIIGVAGIATGLFAAPAAGQATFEWFGLGDGASFTDPLNWTPNGLPGLLDEAKFDNAGIESLSFALSPSVGVTSVENDTVQFNLTGRTYTTGELVVGDRLTDIGMLTLNGGHLETTTVIAKVGRLFPATGTLLLTNGASMTNQRDLIIGDEGTGSFQLDAGCAVTSFVAFIADAGASTGDATINGAWNIQTNLLVGNGGDGTLTVQAGGDVTVGVQTKVGDELLSSGALTVDGSGSTFSCTSFTTVGNFGPASLTVSNGATLTTGGLMIADDANADVLVDAGSIIDSVGVNVGNRALGTMTLANGGAVQSPLVTVVDLGTLSGSGTITGSVLNEGSVNPGNGTGAMTVSGAYTQTLGALNIELGGTVAGSTYDQLVVNGAATVGGTLNVSLVNGFNPSGGDFVILQGGTVAGAFVIENVPPGFTVTYETNRIVVSAPGAGPCSVADLADPLGTLDFSDVIAFLVAFGAQDPSADLALPTGIFDFSDVIAFLSAFGAGCP